MARHDPSDLADTQASRAGFVYVLTHENMRGPDGTHILKIGATRKHPIQRATELSAGSGVPGQFTVAYYRRFDDAFAAERWIHEALKNQRIDSSREFFRGSPGEVMHLTRALSEHLSGSSEEGGEWLGGDGEGEREQGVRVSAATTQRYPFAALFASFPDDGEPRQLTADEVAQCRQLFSR